MMWSVSTPRCAYSDILCVNCGFFFISFFFSSTKQKSKQVRKKRVADVITENNDEYTISLMGSSSTYQSDNTVHNIYHESAIWLVKYFHQANSLIL